ncbi:MAG: hypothetical protein LBS21_13355 [Clostridiales bacterium]|jgi:flagellar motility protein MotE (MotC chaperone)|nr:hypothetical protein [Clostridiales bacterium]
MAAKVKEQPLIEEEIEQAGGNKSPKQKKQKAPKEKKSRARRGPGAGVVVVIFILLIVGALAAVIGFNLFGLRDRYLAPLAADIPIVGNLIPPADSEADSVAEADLQAQIRDLEYQVTSLQRELDDAGRNLELRQEEIDRLSVFEQQWSENQEARDEFDRMVALNNPQAYAAYYESISPENAEILYPEAKQDAVVQREISRYLTTIDETDESSTAQALEQLVPTDLDMVVSILKGITEERSAAILDEMSAENSAAILKRWFPLGTP